MIRFARGPILVGSCCYNPCWEEMILVEVSQSSTVATLPRHKHKLDNSKLGSTVARIISSQNIYGLKHHIVEIRGGVTDAGQPNEVKIELLSHWKLSFAIILGEVS